MRTEAEIRRKLRLSGVSCKDRLAELIAEREITSKTMLTLIGELEKLAERFKRVLIHSGSVKDETIRQPACRSADRAGKGPFKRVLHDRK